MTDSEYNEHIREWSGHILRFCLWNCGNRERSEDAMQEAFAQLWEKRVQVEVAKGLPYLLTVSRRYLIDCYRHNEVDLRARAELNGGSLSVESTGEIFELSDMLYTAMCKLPEVQRSILQLRDVEGYSYKEIADILTLSQQQVQVYLFRARVTMKKFFQNN